MSPATAFTRGVAWASCLASSKAQPLDMDSCSRLQSPPGSAAVIAMLATTGLATMRDHSSGVKLDLLAISGLLTCCRAGGLPIEIAQACAWFLGRAGAARPKRNG